MNIYKYIIIVLFILSFYITFKYYVGIDNLSKGYGKSTESVETLLTKIQWSNQYNGRNNIIIKTLFFSIIITFFVCRIYDQSTQTDYSLYLQCVIVVWLILMCFSSYFSHHADKFDSYFISNNIRLIRKKLKLKPVNTLKTYKLNKKEKNKCHNFIYS